MRTRVYVVEQVSESADGEETSTLLAIRLTNAAARAIAREAGNRKVTGTYATKDEVLIHTDIANQQRKEQQDGDS